MSRYLKTFLGIVVSLFFIWLVLKEVDYALLWESITQFNIAVLLFGLVIWVVGYLIRGWRWQILLHPVRHISYKTSFEILVIGFTANNLLPLRAGEFVRSYLLGKKEDIPKTTVFATVAAERLFDGIIILGLTIVGASTTQLPEWMRTTIVVSGLIFVVGLLGLAFLLFYNRQTMQIIGWFLRLLPVPVRAKVEQLLNVFTSGIEFLRDPRILLLVTLSTLSIWLLETVFYYLAALSFGFSITFMQALVVKGILNLGILIPSGPGYVGTFEFLVVRTLMLFGIAETPALGYALVTHVVEFVVINLLGVWYWVKYGLGISVMSKTKEKIL